MIPRPPLRGSERLRGRELPRPGRREPRLVAGAKVERVISVARQLNPDALFAAGKREIEPGDRTDGYAVRESGGKRAGRRRARHGDLVWSCVDRRRGVRG